MWPFGTRQIVDDDTAGWHVENFSWLAHQFGGGGRFERSRLVLPDREFFRADGETGHALALRLFDQVKAHCGLAERSIRLIPDHNPLAAREPWSPVMVEGRKHAAGTFYNGGYGAEITYVPQLLDRPQNLIATLAHELSHYVLATARRAPVCEPDEEEFLTDLTAVFLGFGVFMANARLDHEANGAVSSAGYLPQPDLIFALALYLRAKDLDPAPAYGALKPHLASLLKRALKAMPPDHSDVAEVRKHWEEAERADGGAKVERRFRVVE